LGDPKSMRSDRQRSRQSRLPDRLIWGLGVAFALAALVSGVLVFSTVRGLAAAWSGTGLPSFSGGSPSAGPTSEPGVTPTVAPLEEAPKTWDGSERITILLMGLDYRDWLTGDGPPRTDSMMLITIDPVTHTAGMLSIPRDLWVEIPGFEHNRVNTAYFLGESYKLPGGGPALAMKTVENFIGVPIQYYAVIDFHAFEEMIDEIGGIDVYVSETIKISPIGKESHLLFGGKGTHLNGPDALAYARVRKSEGGDFDRAQRQQQVALAIRDRVLGFNMIPTLVSKAPKLYQELSGGIRTNLTFDQMLRLALLALDIPTDNIKKGIISPPDMVQFETLPTGAQVLRPIPDQIRVLRDDIFTTTGAIAPSIPTDDPAAAAKVENARISVLNGAGVEGLAGRTADYLSAQGLDVATVANADRLDYAKSIIIDYTGKPYTAKYLMDLMGLSESQILSQANPDSDVDLAVILGADWQVPP
jgi:LCP family protein required for cell wall assembly